MLIKLHLVISIHVTSSTKIIVSVFKNVFLPEETNFEVTLTITEENDNPANYTEDLSDSNSEAFTEMETEVCKPVRILYACLKESRYRPTSQQ